MTTNTNTNNNTAATRVKRFSISGSRGEWKNAVLQAYEDSSGRCRSVESALNSLCRRVGRGLGVVTLREDSHTPSGSVTYQATLGTSVEARYGGGFTPRCEVWVTVEAGQ